MHEEEGKRVHKAHPHSRKGSISIYHANVDAPVLVAPTLLRLTPRGTGWYPFWPLHKVESVAILYICISNKAILWCKYQKKLAKI